MRNATNRVSPLTAQRDEVPLLDGQGNHDRSPDHEADSKQPGELVTGNELLDQDNSGYQRNPPQVHYAKHEENSHQCPTTSNTQRTVVEPHHKCSSVSASPIAQQEAQGGPALVQAGTFGVGELVGPRPNEEEPA